MPDRAVHTGVGRRKVTPGGAEEGRRDAGPLFLREGRVGIALAGSAWAGTGHAVSMEMPGGKYRVAKIGRPTRENARFSQFLAAWNC